MTGENKIITIDCGLSGGWCIKPNDDSKVFVHKLREDFVDLTEQFWGHAGAVAFVETQHLRKIDCQTGRWHNIHKLCLHYQRIKDALECCDITVKELSPVKWQKHFQLKCQTYKDRKKELKDHCIKLFPDQKVTLWNCDALLMMEYVLTKKLHKK